MKRFISLAVFSLCCSCGMQGELLGNDRHIVCYSDDIKMYDGYTAGTFWVSDSYVYFRDARTKKVVELINAACLSTDADIERDK